MTIPLAVARQSEIGQIIAEAETELRPLVQHIRWEIGTDWSGDWAIFLRVTLSNAAARGRNLQRTTQQVRAHLLAKLKPQELGVIPYFSFRSQSEQAALREEAWM